MLFNPTWLILAFSVPVDFGLIFLLTSIYVKQNQENETEKKKKKTMQLSWQGQQMTKGGLC